jgi:fructose-1,6-bisphosphatase/sedoheptulose 1,7-bisphosphatase-like protein
MPHRRHDPERRIDLDLVRCTENVALAAWKWFGKGDKNRADLAAADSMRGMFGLIECTCLGGEQLSRMWPKNEEEKRLLLEEEDYSQADLDRIWTVEEMALRDRVIFVATGSSDSPLLRGSRYEGRRCLTESILIRARNRTVRQIEAHHDMSRKTFALPPPAKRPLYRVARSQRNRND